MRFLPVFLALTSIAALGAGCSPSATRLPEQGESSAQRAKQAANTQPSVTITTPQAMPVYSADEVSVHTIEKDCWMTIHGKVYDMSSFIPIYPDKKTLTDQCGKDASEAYDHFSKAADSKSADALKMLPKYEIGTSSPS
jgi:cytochrome b involved in lipid metabolism